MDVFPDAAVPWLTGLPGRTVQLVGGGGIEIGLTQALAGCLRELGHTVRQTLAVQAGEFDVVITNDPDDAGAAASVLTPYGAIVVLQHGRDHRIPWARKLDRALDLPEPDDPIAAISTAGRYGFVDKRSWRAWQTVNVESLQGLIEGEADLRGWAPEQRVERIRDAMELYADYGRGHDGMQLPWLTTAYRAELVDPLVATSGRPTREEAESESEVTRERAGGRERAARLDDSSFDDAVLLIDYR